MYYISSSSSKTFSSNSARAAPGIVLMVAKLFRFVTLYKGKCRDLFLRNGVIIETEVFLWCGTHLTCFLLSEMCTNSRSRVTDYFAPGRRRKDVRTVCEKVAG